MDGAKISRTRTKFGCSYQESSKRPPFLRAPTPKSIPAAPRRLEQLSH